MQAKSIKGKSINDIEVAMKERITSDFIPTLAIVFASVQQDIKELCALLSQNNMQVFGSTTAGEFIDGEIETGAIAILLLDMHTDYFRVELIETSKEKAQEDALKLGIRGSETFENPAFVIASGGVALDGEDIIEGIINGVTKSSSITDASLIIFGGKAGDDLVLNETYVFSKEKKSTNAIIGLIIDHDKIDVQGIATCGWNAIGTTKTVTRSNSNVVYTIYDKPTLDMLMNYLGVDIKQDGNNNIVTFLSSWYYPLQLERENVAPVIRTAMFADRKERALICSGNVPQGSKIKFSMPPDFDSMEKVVAECFTIKEEAIPQADALIMFSCVSRYLSFGEVIKEEIEGVQDIWGAPMVGFFTYGEYGKSKTGKIDYHNNACCLVALKEK